MSWLNSRTGVAGLSIVSNSLLVVTKLVVGLLIGSVSVISEAIHSGIDLLAAIIAFVAVRKASVPADADHPFGHGKMENLSGTIEAALIFVAAGLIVVEAIRKLFKPLELGNLGAGLAVMGLSVILNVVVSSRLMAVAKREDSVALEADALHLRTDVWTSVGVFLGLGLIQLTGLVWIDSAVAIGVALIIAHAAWELTRRSMGGLVDEALPGEELEFIKKLVAEEYPQVIEIHQLRSRKAGPERFLDLHMVVWKDLPVSTAHDLCDRLEADIESRLPRSNVTIHVEPCCRIVDGKFIPHDGKKSRTPEDADMDSPDTRTSSESNEET